MKFLAKHLAVAALALAPLAAPAQDATEAEQAVLGEIAKCLVAGLPRDWRDAEMTVDLPQPGAESGEVKYVMRRALAGGEFETFLPCDNRQPARLLVEMRKLQPVERAAWKSARFVLHRDGKFDLKYDYPKQK
jgi:hypothetical protein